MANKNESASPLDKANEQGFLGEEVDPTPNEAYTVAGVTSGATTPETQAPGSEGSTKLDPDFQGAPTQRPAADLKK